MDKKYINSRVQLKSKLLYEINKFVMDNEIYFRQFSVINLYYDNGQESLGDIINNSFSYFHNVRKVTEFDHS